MGRYVPPDLEGTTSGNALHKKRAPGTLRKDGTQTVRFEMPFAVICHTCQPLQIIGQGVRFNAVKTR
ncbi:Protein saf4, partial [Friedmanniomyces endolithicus]